MADRTMPEDGSSRRGIRLVFLLVFGAPLLTAALFYLGTTLFGFGHISGSELIAIDEPVGAIAALDNGGLVYAERSTGRVYSVASDGTRQGPLLEVEVSSDGDRGLLGLAIDGETLFVSWTDADGRLTVGRTALDGAQAITSIWEGPESTDRGNGGRLHMSPDGTLVIGIGNLQNPDAIDDPGAPNGKLLGLDPEGPPDQTPELISSGWHDPTAFTFTPEGALWVADGAPSDLPERLLRGDTEEGPVTEFEDRTAPSGLAAIDDTTLVVCGSLTEELSVYRVDANGRAYTSRAQPTLATDCETGAVLLSDGRIAYGSDDALRISEPP